MLTVLSWIIFVPSTIFNIIVWWLIVQEFLTTKNFSLKGEWFKESKEIAVYNLSSHRWEEIKDESKDVDISDGKFVK